MKTHLRPSSTLLIIFLSLVPFALMGQQTLTLSPDQDAYTQGTGRGNETNKLRLQQSGPTRTVYLKFAGSTINGTITSVALDMTVFSDSGNGTVTVYKANSSSWTETTITGANAPGTSTNLGSRSSSGSGLHSYNLSLADPSLYQGTFTLVLKHTGTNDLAYASSENTNTAIRPKLKITYTENTTDTTAPSAPSNLQASVSGDTVSLSWGASTDDSGMVDGYQVFHNGTQITTQLVTGTQYQVTGLADGSHAFTVRAYDAANNESGASNTATADIDTSGGGTGGHWTKESDNRLHYTAGNVGIGTSTPRDYKLAVNGDIRAKRVKVETTNWPDYVFTKAHHLPTLEEVRQHIAEKGHLPNIPPATEVEANGLDLGEMDRLLLEKIEELTLYILELEAKVQKLQKK
ncbi:MAG: hypothetical protein AB3N16_09740 [Flavobacteriaceae bacterium]